MKKHMRRNKNKISIEVISLSDGSIEIWHLTRCQINQLPYSMLWRYKETPGVEVKHG